ncbi:unnamed protein product [Thlaspi arvense]|uniref:EF-hand domain-containing protein n=1 Tax=Thlaspi arvense TaxID=13288 RepID=A0AAU9RW03_THLAR|nr:unnamed protein product [Thlaspi arvense]
MDKRSLARSKTSCSSSFRLRCPSLNALRLRRIFDLFDKNHDGAITVEEINQALQVLGLDADLSELESMVKAFLKPEKIGLEFDDFEALHRSLNDTFFGFQEESLAEEGGKESEKQDEADLMEAFKVFDENGDGFISARELQVVLGKLGLAEGREMDRVERMISSVDLNQDGRVDFFEFKDMMRSVVVKSC